MGEKNRSRMCLLVLYAILLTWSHGSVYRTTANVIEHCQCIEDEYGSLQRFLVWLGFVEYTPKCPSASTVIKIIGWDMLFVLAVGAACEAGRIIGNMFSTNDNHDKVSREEREPTEELYLMKNMLRERGEVIILRMTKTKEEVIHFDKRTRKFRTVMVLPRLTEEEYSSIFD